MEGTSIPYLLNHLRKSAALADRVENGRQIESLKEHPGWAVLCEHADLVAEHGAERLQQMAVDVAMKVDLQQRVDFAKRVGAQSATTFHVDVAESILASAKTAASELKADAEKAEAGGQ